MVYAVHTRRNLNPIRPEQRPVRDPGRIRFGITQRHEAEKSTHTVLSLRTNCPQMPLSHSPDWQRTLTERSFNVNKSPSWVYNRQGVENGKERAMERCFDCGSVIGEFDVPHKRNNMTVCLACHKRASAGPNRYAQLIEQTHKRWKVYELVGVPLLLLGVVALCVVFGTVNDRGVLLLGSVICVMLIATGLIMWAVGRLGGWWHHG
jgi:DNA-directed RNA polymerase subunit N (RpoN/RPB10)